MRFSSPATATSLNAENAESAPVEVEKESPPPAEATFKRPKWNKVARRTGLIALKLGMTQLWNKNGESMAVTLLQVIDNQVVMVRTKEKEGYYALQVGAIDHPKLQNVKKPMLGQFQRAGVPPKRKLIEFKVTRNALLPAGMHLDTSHYVPGQFVDVCAKSIGKGFQGVMKRHNMKGQPASHGVTKTHRKMGATGGGQDPGRVFPGKKMPGRMGGKRVTLKCRRVLRINHRHNVLYVKGPVPGPTNSYVRITDAKMKPNCTKAPFPTYIPSLDGDPSTLPEEEYASDIHPPHQATLLFKDSRKRTKKK